MAQLNVAGNPSIPDRTRVHTWTPYRHFSPFMGSRPCPFTDSSTQTESHLTTNTTSQTGLTWLPTSTSDPSLLALVAGAEQSHILITRDWILVWLFEIRTLLTSIAARVNNEQHEPFLKQADAERLMIKLIVAYKYASRCLLSSMMIQ